MATLFGLSLSMALLGCPAPGDNLVRVPYLGGLLQPEAEFALSDAGLAVGEVMTEHNNAVGKDRVISQNPYAGLMVAEGSAVRLVVSLGPFPTEVPDVAGLTFAQAQAALAVEGFTTTVVEVFSETVPTGSVVSQTPEAGQTAPFGSNVQLEVSKGPEHITVPDVVGLTQSQAEFLITNALLTLGEVVEQWSNTVEAGRVISQDPLPAESAERGDPVNLVVSKGVQPATVPELVGMEIREAETALTEAGLTLGEITETVSDTAAVDSVMAQDPAPGEEVTPGAAVDLEVSLGSDEMVLHTQVWQDAIAAAASDDHAKYGIYASRSLMVAHPEVYLAADAVWMEQLVTVYGGWLAEYGHRDRAGDEDYWFDVGGGILQSLHDDTAGSGTEFAWASFSWDNHRANAAPLREFYGNDAPFRNWLDMRLPLMWNAIKGTQWRTPRMSLGEALFFQLRQHNDFVYLLVTDTEHAYVAVAGEPAPALYDPFTGETMAADDVNGEIVLATDDRHAWYPLMGRDDTGLDEYLEQVVSAYCAEEPVPALTRAEEAMLDDIAAATALPSDMHRAWAVLFASRFGDSNAWASKVVRDLCSQLFPQQYHELTAGGNVPDSPYEHVALNMVVTEIANRLSPASAVLAMLARDNNDSADNALQALSDRYSEWFERTDTAGVFGAFTEIWVPSLDDKAISRVGNGLSEACSTAAAVYIAQLADWHVWITHGWLGGSNGTRWLAGVYTPGGNRSISTGVFDAGSPACLRGPIFGSGYGVPVNALLYKLGAGYLYTGQRVADVPFSNLSWAAAGAFLTEVAALEPAARFATGDPSLVTPKDLTWLQTMMAMMQSDWVAYQFPPLGTELVQVPALAGVLFEDVPDLLQPLELMIGNVDRALTSYEAGYVASQLPAAGTYVVPGTAIDLTVSDGLAPDE